MNKHAVFIFVVSLTLYTFTLFPGVGGSLDSAEFQISGKVLGISHPTGYPLYHLISYFNSLIPIQTLALRMTFLSAIWISLTTAFLFVIIKKTCNHILISYIASFLFMTSYPIWHNATITEVYAMQFFIHAIIILSYMNWLETKNANWMLLCSLCAGIGLAHHLMTTIVVVGILFTGYAFPARHQFEVKTSLLSVLLFCFPLLTFLYFPIRSAMGAHSFDYYEFRSMTDYIHYFLGGNNTNLLRTDTIWILNNGILNGVQLLMKHWGVFPVLLTMIGIYEWIKTKRIETILILWIALIHILLTGIWTEADQEAILVPAMISSSIFMAIGLQSLIIASEQWIPISFLRHLFIILIFIPFISLNTYNSYQTISARNQFSNTEYYQRAYQKLPDLAIVLTSYWEETNILKYIAWSGEFENKDIHIFRWNDPRSRAGTKRWVDYMEGNKSFGNPPIPPNLQRSVFFLQPPDEKNQHPMLTLQPIPLETEGFIYQAKFISKVYQEEKGYIPLSQTRWELIEWNWIEPQPKQSVNGNPLMINNVLYSEGYGIHAGTKIRIPVPDGAKAFSFIAGISSDLPKDAPSSIITSLSSSQKLLLRSPVLTTQSEEWAVDYVLQNESHLILEFWGTEDGLKADHAVLAMPRFYFTEPPDSSN